VAAAFEPPPLPVPEPEPEDGFVPFAFGVALGFAEPPESLGFAELPEPFELSAAGLLADPPESAEPASEPELEPEPEPASVDDADPDPPASAPTRSERAFESLRLSVR
jgi:hypothetical protein